ncbi:MAG: type and secretion system protein family protein [Nevskia sp.]|nr:type and secretion system protein family protein [Nevskia sp.]
MYARAGIGGIAKAGVIGLLLGLFVTLPAIAASNAPRADAPAAAPSLINVEVGTQKVLRQVHPIRRLAVGEPKVADVSIINSRELLISGKALGVTNLLVWPGDGGAQPTEYRVQVGFSTPGDSNPDLAQAQVTPGVGISGSTPTLLAHRQAELSSVPPQQAGDSGGSAGDRASKVIDRSVVQIDTQVLSQIKIVEVNRTSLQEYGLNFLARHNGTVGGIGAPGSISGADGAPSGAAGTISSATSFIPIANAFNLVYASGKYLGALSILENQGLARTLAEPSLIAQSGQTASFLAGGEFPVPVPQGSGGGSTTVTIQFKEFGVRLNLTPTVLANNRIQLKVAPEVSELDYTNGVNIQGFVVPGLIVRRTDTSVELGDGESFVISGLVSDTLKNSVNKVPWLGDLPYIGAFFRQTSISRNDKELIMVVTPHLVHPLRRDDQLPQLPGQTIEDYHPSFARTMFLETGKFGQSDDSGYSR